MLFPFESQLKNDGVKLFLLKSDMGQWPQQEIYVGHLEKQVRVCSIDVNYQRWQGLQVSSILQDSAKPR